MSPFYSDPAVRQRLIEYLGGDTLDSATAVYVTHSDGCLFQRSELYPPAGLGKLLDLELDVARSLADRESLLFHLDIEYVNFDSPAEAYADPYRAFGLQEPVVRVVEELLLGWGITPLHLITGQGHHFVWRVGINSEVAGRIAALDPAPESTSSCHGRAGNGVAGEIGLEMQRMFTAVALPMEYLAHRIKWLAAPLSELPVEITAVHVGPGAGSKREIVSIDISEYGDPLHTRMVRMPYTNYLKPWVSGLAEAWNLGDGLPRFRAIPLFEMNFREAIECRGNEKATKDLARRACTAIPRHDDGTMRFLEDYLASDLRKFHEHFYSVPHVPKEQWGEAYEPMPTGIAPCGSILLERPNDLLLKPAGMQLVTRLLLGLGWHPRHVAGIIRSRFENPRYGWGVDWGEYDAGVRADFYVRIFAGLLRTGVDELVDFNCVSTAEKGFCSPTRHQDCSLCPFKEELTKTTLK
ncbi:MAG: hypothetical protein ACSHX9_06360 [Luteolibacter sp.]